MLDVHSQLEKEANFVCGICYHIFSQKDHYNTHIDTHKGRNKELAEKSNNLCNNTSSFENQAKAQRLEELPEVVIINEYACEKCDFIFSDLLDLNAHIQSLHNQETKSCNKDTQTKSKASVGTFQVDNIKTIVEDEIVVCPFCKFESKDREQLKKHIDNIHIEKKTENNGQDNIISHSFKCGLCANEFSEFDSLKLHMETNHKSTQPAETSSCKYCGLVFLNSNLLNEHIGAYHVTKRITCRYCDFSVMKARVIKTI